MEGSPTGLSVAERRKSRVIVAAFIATIAYLIVSHAHPGAAIIGCPFHAVTGYSCFGCGMTRSTAHFLHGDILAALRFHPFGPPFVVAFALTAAHNAAELVADRRLEYAALRLWRRIETPTAVLAAIVLGAFGVGRLALELAGFLTPL